MVETAYNRLPKVISRQVEQRGVVLKYVHRKKYEPDKGTILDAGEVFISLDLLYEISERTMDDYLYGNPPPSVGLQEKLALVAAGLAVEETRGGIHGTEKLVKWISNQ